MRIKLSATDRERFGCPEWLSVQTEKLGLREALALDAAGIDALALDELIRTVPVLDAAGQPVLDEDGEPKRRVLPSAWQALVWLGLYRAGVHVDYDSFDFDLFGLQTAADEGEVSADDEGKAEPAADLPEPAPSEG